MSNAELQQPRRFRWRILGITFCIIFGVLSILYAVSVIAGMIYIHVQFGWADYRFGENKSRDEIAFTTMNIARIVIFSATGVTFFIAARQWRLQHRRAGWIWTLCAYGLMGIANLMTSLR